MGEEHRTIFDFSRAESFSGWITINDTVMGGRSHSRFTPSGEGTAVFEGEISLEYGGGFAMIRCAWSPLGLSDCQGLDMKLRGDGRRYKVYAATGELTEHVFYQWAFDAPPGEWTTVRAPFRLFEETYLGRPLESATPLDPSRVRHIGVIIDDAQAGPFRFEIASITAYCAMPR